MILTCTDTDIIKMLELRKTEKDPVEVLEEKKIRFELEY